MVSASRHVRRFQLVVVATLTLVLSGGGAVPLAVAAGSGILSERALLRLAMELMPDPALVRAIDGTQAITYGSDGRLTFLLLGSDLRPNENVASGSDLTDMIMVLTINPSTGRMAAASIPRDMAFIPRPGETTWSRRINELFQHYRGRGFSHAVALGKVKDVVAHLLNTEIDHVAMIRFISFEAMLDELGPIRVDIPKPVKDPKLIDGGYPVGVYFPAATNYILVGSPTSEYPKCNGHWRRGPNTGQRGYDCHRALMYARTRKGKGNSDFKRQKRGVDIVMAAIHKAIANDNGTRLQDLQQLADAQDDRNFYSSLPMTWANALDLYGLLDDATLVNRVVFKPKKYASKVSGSAKYRINVKAVRSWIAANFKNV